MDGGSPCYLWRDNISAHYWVGCFVTFSHVPGNIHVEIFKFSLRCPVLDIVHVIHDNDYHV